MELIYSLKQYSKTDAPSIFLAGPTVRVGEINKPDFPVSWRKEAINLLKILSFDGRVYIPEFESDILDPEFTLSRQVDWETKALNDATVILFWIPRDMKILPAFTTNIEFGEWLGSGKITIGAPPEAPKNDYIKERCSRKSVPWYSSLEGCVKASVGLILKLTKLPEPTIWVTADTHFGSERTNVLSKRPFSCVEEMDWSIVRNWNSNVKPADIVYHLGDFGEPDMVKHLNGYKIFIVPGNYDKPEILDRLRSIDSRITILDSQHTLLYESTPYLLTHEPLVEIASEGFYLFGHIHKLQMVKKNGLNVGQDCHNFTPINFETIAFYRTAILKHYDKYVFCNNN